MNYYLSPAKVNLFFKVLKKREDNYHEIASIYQAVSLYDRIGIEKSKKDEIISINSLLKFNSSNLIIRALNLFREKTDITTPISIHLEKNIPIEAGLGGGSSNASTTLFALNDLFDRPLSLNEMIELSKKIGADSAFFFSKGSAFCTDTGTTFENINIKDLSFYIAKPNFGVSTKEVFENLNLNLLKKRDINEILISYLIGCHKYFNDLEVASFKVESRLIKVKQTLKNMGFESVVMSGSGSSFFCFGDKEVQNTKEISYYLVKSIKRKDGFWYS